MRRLTPLALLLAAACGRAPSTPDAEAEAFDPNSAENTLAWAASVWIKHENTPKGNAPAREEAMKKIQAEVDAGAKGKSIRWPVRVLSIGSDSTCHISAPEKRDVPRDPLDGKQRRFVLIISAKNPNADNRPETALLHGFQSSPPRADWLKKLATGDRVILVGTVAYFGRQRGEEPRGEWTDGFCPILTDSHVESP